MHAEDARPASTITAARHDAPTPSTLALRRVAIELRLPPGSPPPVAAPDGEDYVVLYSGPKPRTHTGPLDVAASGIKIAKLSIPTVI